MRQELTPDELNREFYGPPPVIEVKFYQESVTDIPESKKQGVRIHKHVPYIHMLCHKENTEIRRPATAQDKRKYSREWKRYEDEHNERLRPISEESHVTTLPATRVNW